MGISNYYPNSRVSQPGVCTSTTRPALPYEGQVIYETDTDKVLVWTGSGWSNAGVPTGGSAGQVLTKTTSSDYDTSWTGPMGLVLIKTQTIGTTVSSIPVTGVFSAEYDQYLITINGGAASTALDGRLVLGASATGYYGGLPYINYSTATLAGSADNNAVRFSLAWRGETGNLTGHIILQNPYLAKTTQIFAHIVQAGLSGVYNGYHNAATSYTDFTLSTSTGTVTGGTIRVYGYRN